MTDQPRPFDAEWLSTLGLDAPQARAIGPEAAWAAARRAYRRTEFDATFRFPELLL